LESAVKYPKHFVYILVFSSSCPQLKDNNNKYVSCRYENI